MLPALIPADEALRVAFIGKKKKNYKRTHFSSIKRRKLTVTVSRWTVRRQNFYIDDLACRPHLKAPYSICPLHPLLRDKFRF